MNIGETIRELRIKNNLTQQNIADHLGINRTTYVKYETGDIGISAKVLNILANLFFVPTDYLLGRNNNETSILHLNPKELNFMFGQRLKELRLSKGITQKELATIAGVDRTSIGKYESRNVVPNLEVIYLLADYFGVTIDYLLGREPNEDKKNSLPPLNQKDEKDISAALDKILNNLESSESLSFYGEPMDEHTKELIKLSLENSMKMAKQMAKKKFTPKKYR